MCSFYDLSYSPGDEDEESDFFIQEEQEGPFLRYASDEPYLDAQDSNANALDFDDK